MNKKCNFEFEAFAGMVTCNRCDSIYVEWLSYIEFEKEMYNKIQGQDNE